jgi:type IV secretory pathway TraG/TraD family ATPase VirD4
VILHSGDARSPYWTIGDEVTNDLDAHAVAASLIPYDDRETNKFFPNSARTVFAALLKFRPTPHQLVEWISDPDAIAKVLTGTTDEKSVATILDAGAPQQRGGVMAALNLVAKTLQLCPTAAECHGRWAAADWAARGTGWVFITSTPVTRDALVPLQTLWLDSIILRLMERVGGPRTHLMLDEVDTLRTLSQLRAGLTEGRKYNLALVLGFQSHAQIEARYGRNAETMLSQAAAQIFLRSSGRLGSEWASKTIGDVETERLQQSRQDGWARSATTGYALERRPEPLVMPSEISGLPNLSGLLKIEGLVTTLRFPYVQRPATHPDFVARPTRALRVAAAVPSEPPPPEPYHFPTAVVERGHACRME